MQYVQNKEVARRWENGFFFFFFMGTMQVNAIKLLEVDLN